MTIWTPSLDDRPGPRYLAIADALANDVARGALSADSRLPTHRDLAYRLGVTVGTVSRAYAEAERRGLVRGEVGRGTFVRAPAAPDAPPIRFGSAEDGDDATVDFSLNCPYEPDDSGFRATLGDLAASPDIRALITFRPGAGGRFHRAAASRLVARLGWEPDPDLMAITNGAQHALSAVLAAVCRPGDTLLGECLTYPGIRAAAELIGLKVRAVEIDEEGLIPDALAEACASGPAKALIVQPTLHNPSTATMGEARRDAIAEVVARSDLTLIEDDVYGHHPTTPRRPIVSRIPDRTVFITSASKCLLPGLRTGYLAAPPSLHEAIVDVIRTTSWMASPLEAEIAARWIDDGHLDRIVAARRRELARRAERLRDAFAGIPVRLPQGSFHAWVSLPEGWTTESVRAAARDAHILIPPTEAFVLGRTAPPRAFRLSISHTSRGQYDEAIPRLAGLLRQPRSRSLAVI